MFENPNGNGDSGEGVGRHSGPNQPLLDSQELAAFPPTPLASGSSVRPAADSLYRAAYALPPAIQEIVLSYLRRLPPSQSTREIIRYYLQRLPVMRAWGLAGNAPVNMPSPTPPHTDGNLQLAIFGDPTVRDEKPAQRIANMWEMYFRSAPNPFIPHSNSMAMVPRALFSTEAIQEMGERIRFCAAQDPSLGLTFLRLIYGSAKQVVAGINHAFFLARPGVNHSQASGVFNAWGDDLNDEMARAGIASVLVAATSGNEAYFLALNGRNHTRDLYVAAQKSRSTTCASLAGCGSFVFGLYFLAAAIVGLVEHMKPRPSEASDSSGALADAENAQSNFKFMIAAAAVALVLLCCTLFFWYGVPRRSYHPKMPTQLTQIHFPGHTGHFRDHNPPNVNHIVAMDEKFGQMVVVTLQGTVLKAYYHATSNSFKGFVWEDRRWEGMHCQAFLGLAIANHYVVIALRNQEGNVQIYCAPQGHSRLEQPSFEALPLPPLAPGVTHRDVLGLVATTSYFCLATKDSNSQLQIHAYRGQGYQPLPLPGNFIDLRGLAAGESHQVIAVVNVQNNVDIYTSGDNDFGQLGLGHYRKVEGFQKIILPTTGLPGGGTFHVLGVDAGANFTIVTVLDEMGHVRFYVWGDNSQGQLGSGLAYQVTRPTLLPNFY